MRKIIMTLLMLVGSSSVLLAEESYWESIKHSVSNGVDSVVSKTKEQWEGLDVNLTESKEKFRKFDANLSEKFDNKMYDVSQNVDIDKEEGRLLDSIQTNLTGYGFDGSTASMGVKAGADLFRAVTINNRQMSALADVAIENADNNRTMAKEGSSYDERAKLLTLQLSIKELPVDIQVYMDKGLKSFAGQNGSIRLSSGLLDLLNHDELIFILGHEIAHILYKDDKENYQTTYALAGIKKGAQVTGGLTAYLTQTGIDLISQKLNQTKYSKKKERKADRYGLAYLKAYKLDVSVAISALEKLSKHSAELLTTHPTSVDRVEYLKEHFSQN